MDPRGLLASQPSLLAEFQASERPCFRIVPTERQLSMSSGLRTHSVHTHLYTHEHKHPTQSSYYTHAPCTLSVPVCCCLLCDMKLCQPVSGLLPIQSLSVPSWICFLPVQAWRSDPTYTLCICCLALGSTRKQTWVLMPHPSSSHVWFWREGPIQNWQSQAGRGERAAQWLGFEVG